MSPLPALAFGAFTLLLCVAERQRPLRRRTRPLLQRLVVNGAFGVLALAVVAAAVRPVAESVMEHPQRFAATRSIPLHPLLEIPLVFLLMDLTFYWWHRANHRIPLLWRFHNVHHTDPDLDLSTAFRFHFGELLLSAAFRVVQIGLIAPSLPAYLLYEAFFQAGTLFHHSNLRIPLPLERTLNRVLVTPRMHGIHHSDFRSETNSNYGSVFRWWDRLHGTLVLGVAQEEVVIGVPGYADVADNRLTNLLLQPFTRQREYWPGKAHRAGRHGDDRLV